jgi:arylsulfate sulfotransferase
MNRVLTFSFFLAACSNPPPLLPTLELSADAPLAARLRVQLDRPARLSATVRAGDDSWEHAYDELRTSWDVPLLGLLPDTQHHVTFRATDAEGADIALAPVDVRTSALPDAFPQLEVAVDEPQSREPGFVVFAVPPRSLGEPSHVVALDRMGRVVWYFETLERLSDAVPTPHDTLLLNVGKTQMVEIDMLGHELRRFHARREATPHADSVAVATDTFHHEVLQRADHGFLALSTSIHDVSGYPTSELDATPRTMVAHVVSDRIVELSPDGTLEHELDLFDVLDPTRVTYDSFGAFWDTTYSELAPGTIDWAHANAVIRAGDDYIVSLRHQDAVVRMSRDGEVQWILGPPARWSGELLAKVLTPVGADFIYPYKMHSPALTAEGTLMLFDNGVGRASPPDAELPFEQRFSRAVEYEIDVAAGTVREVWQYGRERGTELYASIVGDADPLPTTGNALLTFGGVLPTKEGVPAAYVLEVSRQTPARVLFEVRVLDDNPDGPASRIVYRAEHVPSLYAFGVD